MGVWQEAACGEDTAGSMSFFGLGMALLELRIQLPLCECYES